MTAPTIEAKRLAIWQTTPCPPWCIAVHDDMDHPDVRECVSDAGITPLTHEDTLDVPTPNGMGVALDTLHTTTEMPFGGVPRVTTSRGTGACTTFSLDEAEQHAMQLMAAVRAGRATVAQQHQDGR